MLFRSTTVVFGCCIYNEIIVLNFWGLNRNTVNEVAKRSIRENNIDENIKFDDNKDIMTISLV